MFFISYKLITLFLLFTASLRYPIVPPFSCYTTSSRSTSASLSWHLHPAPWRFARNSEESPGDTALARSAIIIDEFDEFDEFFTGLGSGPR
jgi:hypothetical protein